MIVVIQQKSGYGINHLVGSGEEEEGRRPIALHFFFPFPFFFFFLPAGGFGSYIAVSQSCLNSGLISKKVRSALSRLRFVYKRRKNIVRDTLMLEEAWMLVKTYSKSTLVLRAELSVHDCIGELKVGL